MSRDKEERSGLAMETSGERIFWAREQQCKGPEAGTGGRRAAEQRRQTQNLDSGKML